MGRGDGGRGAIPKVSIFWSSLTIDIFANKNENKNYSLLWQASIMYTSALPEFVLRHNFRFVLCPDHKFILSTVYHPQAAPGYDGCKHTSVLCSACQLATVAQAVSKHMVHLSRPTQCN